VAHLGSGPELNRRAQLWISPVTYAEVLEGADDLDEVRAHLRRYRWQGLHHAHAEQAALLQRRSRARMGENDAWQASVVLHMNVVVVAHDPNAFARLGAGLRGSSRQKPPAAEHWRSRGACEFVIVRSWA